MRISKVIMKLQKFLEEHGDLDLKIENETETERTTSSISHVKKRTRRIIGGEEDIAIIRS